MNYVGRRGGSLDEHSALHPTPSALFSLASDNAKSPRTGCTDDHRIIPCSDVMSTFFLRPRNLTGPLELLHSGKDDNTEAGTGVYLASFSRRFQVGPVVWDAFTLTPWNMERYRPIHRGKVHEKGWRDVRSAASLRCLVESIDPSQSLGSTVPTYYGGLPSSQLRRHASLNH